VTGTTCAGNAAPHTIDPDMDDEDRLERRVAGRRWLLRPLALLGLVLVGVLTPLVGSASSVTHARHPMAGRAIDQRSRTATLQSVAVTASSAERVSRRADRELLEVGVTSIAVVGFVGMRHVRRRHSRPCARVALRIPQRGPPAPLPLV
jgi:hypothetical protein